MCSDSKSKGVSGTRYQIVGAINSSYPELESENLHLYTSTLILSVYNVFVGGFWYGVCHHTNPNGLWVEGGNTVYEGFAVGINWLTFRGHGYSLKYFTMMTNV